ncbi:hypothetical protein LXL04_032640 [Taraxacum kok-saghyz]
MFSLFYGLWKYLVSKTEFHVVILGIDKAGKTTLFEKLKTQYSSLEGLPPDRIVPTVELNIGRIETSNSKLVFWDLGGQSGLRSIWEKYYEEAHAVIFVVDASCPSRFEESKSALGMRICKPTSSLVAFGMTNLLSRKRQCYRLLLYGLKNFWIFIWMMRLSKSAVTMADSYDI